MKSFHISTAADQTQEMSWCDPISNDSFDEEMFLRSEDENNVLFKCKCTCNEYDLMYKLQESQSTTYIMVYVHLRKRSGTA